MATWDLETIREGKLSNDGEGAVLRSWKSGLERMLDDVKLFNLLFKEGTWLWDRK